MLEFIYFSKFVLLSLINICCLLWMLGGVKHDHWFFLPAYSSACLFLESFLKIKYFHKGGNSILNFDFVCFGLWTIYTPLMCCVIVSNLVRRISLLRNQVYFASNIKYLKMLFGFLTLIQISLIMYEHLFSLDNSSFYNIVDNPLYWFHIEESWQFYLISCF